jgi:hypothetical protein
MPIGLFDLLLLGQEPGGIDFDALDVDDFGA